MDGFGEEHQVLYVFFLVHLGSGPRPIARSCICLTHLTIIRSEQLDELVPEIWPSSQAIPSLYLAENPQVRTNDAAKGLVIRFFPPSRLVHLGRPMLVSSADFLGDSVALVDLNTIYSSKRSDLNPPFDVFASGRIKFRLKTCISVVQR